MKRCIAYNNNETNTSNVNKAANQSYINKENRTPYINKETNCPYINKVANVAYINKETNGSFINKVANVAYINKENGRVRLFFLVLWVMICMGAGVGFAQSLKIDGGVKFRLSCVEEEGSSVAPGSSHGVNSPVCWTYTDATNADCYWYFKEVASGVYTIQNASTGEYMTWDGVRTGYAANTSVPVRRYLTLTTTLAGDSSRWTVTKYSDNQFYVACVLNEQFLDARIDESYALGTFNRTERVPTANERFYFIMEDGTYFDGTNGGGSGGGGDDPNATAGVTSDGLYWCSTNVATPFVVTTNLSNPVYYYIKNRRSDNWLMPNVGGNLAQSPRQPNKRFYFVEADKGVQILVEGGGYVSGGMPVSPQMTYTRDPNTGNYVRSYISSGDEVSVKTGSPNSDDELWSFVYQNRGEFSGYAIKMESCALNNTSNFGYTQYYSRNGYYYLNDYSAEGTGVCWWTAEDDGSTFVFYSADKRHRDLLISEGVSFGDSPHGGGDDTPDVVDRNGYIQLEPIAGDVNYVYLANGQVVGVPHMYTDSISQTRDSIILHTAADTIKGMPSYAYARYEVDSISTVAPVMPVFNSYKFNNKFNRFIIEDAEGVVSGDSVLLTVKGIGKTLRPSFKLDDDVQAFIGDSLQESKVTRVRFTGDVKYTVAHRGYTILRRTSIGHFRLMPLGREVVVRADFLTDHSTAEYRVPTIYINTQGSSPIVTKDEYLSGMVRIDGAGVFPDLPMTDMQIKGRGNTSWTTTGKAPYHMKFNTSLPVLGLKKGKHWNLIANAQSRSATTNAIAMKMAQLVETAGFNHEIPVELYLNGTYRGSYNLTENIGFRNNSIDLDDETSAVMLELDTYYDADDRFHTNYYYLPVNVKEPDLADTSSTNLTKTLISNHFNKAITALYNKEDMTQYFDMDYLARYLLVEDLSMNFEFHHPKSTFLYNPNLMDADSRYIFGPVWDFDWGFGYQDASTYFTVSPTRNFWQGPSSSRMEATRWVSDLRNCSPELDRAYYRLWKQFMEDGSLQELVDFCQDYYDYAAPSLTHNNTIWGGGDASTYSTLTTRSKNWLQQRADYIYGYLANTLGYEALGYGQASTTAILKGDVNGDGSITTADLVCILNYILGLPNEDFDFDQADMDNNNLITVADLIRVRNLIAAQPARSSRFYSLPEAGASIVAANPSYTNEGLSIPLSLSVDEGQYSGVQFDLKIPAGMTVENLDLSASIPDFDVHVAEIEAPADGLVRYRVSIYSGANHLLPTGLSPLTLSLGWGNSQPSTEVRSAILSNVLFATAQGEDERSASKSVAFVCGEPTGINSAVALVGQQGNKLTFRSNGRAALPIYGVDGRLYRVYQFDEGVDEISLPLGIYIINKQKIVVH